MGKTPKIKVVSIEEAAKTATSAVSGAVEGIQFGDKLLMVGGVLFVACLVAHHVFGVGKDAIDVRADQNA